jgi:hypothetical protein
VGGAYVGWRFLATRLQDRGLQVRVLSPLCEKPARRGLFIFAHQTRAGTSNATGTDSGSPPGGSTSTGRSPSARKPRRERRDSGQGARQSGAPGDTRRRGNSLRILVLGIAAALVLAGAGSAAGRGRGCFAGHTYPFGDPHRVYAVPLGCVWLLRPDGSYYSIGPEIHARTNGTTDGVALPRDPIGEAVAVCGFSTFTVAWPRFVVTARRVFWGDGAAACVTLPVGDAVRWDGRFVWRPRSGPRAARWEAVLVRSSPPLQR